MESCSWCSCMLMDQRWDLGNYLRERAVPGFLSVHSMSEVFAELMQLLELYSNV